METNYEKLIKQIKDELNNGAPSMKISYDYEEFIQEIINEIADDSLKFNETIKVVRGTIDGYDYRPIIDYYYEDYEPNEPTEPMKVKDVLNEMIEMNKII